MAGIGFALEQMADGRSIQRTLSSYSYAAFLVAGPWLIMVFAIASLSANACPRATCAAVEGFRSILIYNFLFSMIASGAIVLPVTRFVSDEVYAQREKFIVGALAVAAIAYAAVAVIWAAPFYLFATSLTPALKLAAVQNFILFGGAWIAAPFLGVLRDYRTVSVAFALGAITMTATSAVLGSDDAYSLIMSMNAGLAVTAAVILWRLISVFGARIELGAELGAIARYKDLCLIGLAVAVGGWIDKVVMWSLGPKDLHLVAEGGLRTLPAYDAAMFWAQLTAIPLFIGFFVHIETGFFRRHQSFYRALGKQASHRDVEARLAELASYTLASMARMFLAAMLVAGVGMLSAFVFFERIGMSAEQLGTLRVGLLGSALHTCFSIGLIFILYFDLRRAALACALFFVGANAMATVAISPLGFPYMGYGYLIASAASFALVLATLVRELPWLHYHAVITNNSALRGT